MKKYHISDLIEYATSKGGRIENDEYKGLQSKYKWVCKNGHVFEAIGNIINKKSWCKQCAGLSLGSIEKYDVIARQKGGRCLSKVYVNSAAKLDWECALGHVFKAKPNSVQTGYWCAKCAGKLNLTIQDCYDYAKSKNGKCLSSSYSHNKDKIWWQCESGHKWEAQFGNVKKGAWCPECAKDARGLFFRRDFSELKELALKRGGELLSEESSYKNRKSKLKWVCAVGHYFEMSHYNMFTTQKSWCKTCSEGRGERLCRYVFERIFKKPFNKVRPDWLEKLELDGYNDELKIAFEHQGQQHFNKAAHRYSPDIVERDIKKKELCLRRGILLIEIPEVFTMISPDHLLEFVLLELICKKVNLDGCEISFKITDEIIFNQSITEENNRLKNQIEAIVLKANHSIIAVKYNKQNRLEYDLSCPIGHTKKYLSSEIIQKPIECYHCRLHELKNDEMKIKLKSLNCQLVREYMWGDLQAFEIQCSNDHRTRHSRNQILQDTWCCSICKSEENQLNKITEEINKGQFICIEGPHYKGKRFRVRLECSNKHSFFAQVNDLINGNVICRQCK
jgi:hypothetical protein